MNERLESTRFPYLPVRLETRTRTLQIEALMDTGVDGDVAVPPSLLANHEPDVYHRWTLADGSHVYAPLYVGTVRIGDLGKVEGVITALGDEPLVGRGVTTDFV